MICRLGSSLPMLLALICIVFGATSSSALVTCDLECESGTPNKLQEYSNGKYTVELYSIGSTNTCELSVQPENAAPVFHLSTPGLGSGISIDRESGDPISGDKVPVLKLSVVSNKPEPGHYEARYIFASLGDKFEVLKEIRNNLAVHVKRLNKDGPIYLVTWDDALYRYLLHELQSSFFVLS